MKEINDLKHKITHQQIITIWDLSRTLLCFTDNLKLLSLEGLPLKPTFPSAGPEVDAVAAAGWGELKAVGCWAVFGGVLQLALLETDCPDCVLSTLQVPVSCPSFKLGGVGDVLLG